MAKRKPSGRPQPGGRVTEKGTRPAGGASAGGTHRGPATPGRGIDPVRSRMPAAPHVPTRAGHHRGQR